MNLYLYLKQNRNIVLLRIMNYKDIFMPQEDSFTSSDITINTTEESVSTESIESIHSNNKTECIKTGNKCLSILYNRTIHAETWQHIGPQTVTYKEHGRYNSTRKYSVLQ